MTDDDSRPAWLDDDDDAPPSRRRLRLLLVAAALPWLLVGAVVVRSGTAGAPAPRAVPDHADHLPSDPADGAAPRQPDVLEPSAPGPGADLGGADGWGDDLPHPDARASRPDLGASGPGAATPAGVVDADLAGVAIVVARAWLTGIDPVLSLAGMSPAEPGTYAEHLVVEAVEQPAPATAVVSLGAVLLEPEGDSLRTTVRRLAVPLVVGADGARPAGSPWWLPERQLDPVALPTVPVEDIDEQLAAAEAVSAAGYLDVELTALERTEAGPWIAHVSATTPGGAWLEGPVWLRKDAQGFVLLGSVPTVGAPAGPAAEAVP